MIATTLLYFKGYFLIVIYKLYQISKKAQNFVYESFEFDLFAFNFRLNQPSIGVLVHGDHYPLYR